MEKFTIVRESIKKVNKFNVRSRQIEFKIKPVPVDKNPIFWFKGSVEDVIKYSTEDVPPDNLIGFSFYSKQFKDREPGWASFKRASHVTFEDVWGVFSLIFQSNPETSNLATFILTSTTVRLPTDLARTEQVNTFLEEYNICKGIIEIKNVDNLCLPRAIVTAMSFAEKNDDLIPVQMDIDKMQRHKALELLEHAAIRITKECVGLPHLPIIQDYLKYHKITVYEYDSNGRKVLFEGNPNNFVHKINLLHHKQNYNVITSLTATFSCNFYCETCHIPYNSKKDHHCTTSCPYCMQAPPCRSYDRVYCKECNGDFSGLTCYNNHLAIYPNSLKSLCSQKIKCDGCLATINRKMHHYCGEFFCKLCCTKKPEDHLCYIKPDSQLPNHDDLLFIFFEFETLHENLIDGEPNEKMSEPNLCVLKQYCSSCFGSEAYLCPKCGFKEIVVRINTMENFIQFILNQRHLFRQVICLTHNGRAFEHRFILNYILTKTRLTPEIILSGTKILLLQIMNVKFIDSRNYFSMTLSALPKAFDLPNTVTQRYFPHLFNTVENSNYVGELPGIEFFAPGHTKDTEHDERKLRAWYEENRNETYDMEKEIIEHCKTNINILATACLNFRSRFINEWNVDPFSEANSIASACSLVFTRNFLQFGIIGKIPNHGYRWRGNQSLIGIQWLLWEEKQRNIQLVHAVKHADLKLMGVSVDGYCPETNQIFQFLDCRYHGHACLRLKRDSFLPYNMEDTYLNQRFENRVSSNVKLQSFGYEVIEKWECEFRAELLKNKDLDDLKNHPTLNNIALNPRDAIYGDRTGNTKSYYKANHNEKIRYINVCNLYPWVYKYGKFPIGHPTLVIGNHKCRKIDLTQIDGLIKCTVLPPSNLFHPFLPYKHNDRTIFTLCRTCSSELNKNACDHNDAQRNFIGTWVIDEVKKAIEKGYIIIEIYELWIYTTVQYDIHSCNQFTGLFAKMMNKFIKMKQSALGFPPYCNTNERKEDHIKDVFDNEGIPLHFVELKKNAGTRSFAESILNSFSGGYRENQSTIVNEAKSFYKLITNPSIVVNAILPINEETLIVGWEYKEDRAKVIPCLNIAIAAYASAHARLKLYTYLEYLGRRVLFYDTDSLIYISKDEMVATRSNAYVGGMANKLEVYGDHSYIVEFASGGLKNYAYKVRCPRTETETIICNINGIQIDCLASKTIKFESITNMILNDINEPCCTTEERNREDEEGAVMYQGRPGKRRFMEN